MDPLSITASIIAILQVTSKVIEHLEGVKEAPKDRAQCAIEASNLYQLFTKLRYRIEDGSSNESWYAQVGALCEKDGPLDQYKIALEQLRIKTSPGKFKNAVNSILWKHVKKEVMEVLSQIERIKSLVQIALELDHFQLSRAIKSSVDTVEKHQKSLKDEQLLEWISPLNFAAQQADLISRRQDGTGLWFLDSSEYTQWIQGSEKTLFCPGIPGAGKSMIAAIAIGHLLSQFQSSKIQVCYLFCNYKTKLTQSTLFSAMLRQLAQDMSEIAGPIQRLYDTHSSRNTRPSLEEILASIEFALTKHYSSIYLVIDALDEYTDPQSTYVQFLNRLFDLQSKGNLHIMVTSRSIPDIVDMFASALKLEVRASDSDIEQYVKGQVHLLPKFVQRNEALQHVIQHKLAQAADGMFLLARLYFDSLVDKNTKKKIEQALENLSKKSPESLHQAYDEAIKRIESQMPGRRELAKSVLAWITYAERPLKTEELCHALAIEQDEEDLDRDNIPDAEDIVSVCAGLVTINNENRVIGLVHYTTQEYLEQIRETWIPTARLDLASACLTYISFNHFRSGPCEDGRAFASRLTEYVFYDYTIQHWADHVDTVQEDVTEQAIDFLQNRELVSNILQFWHAEKVSSSTGFRYRVYPQWSHGLHLASMFGLLHITKILLKTMDSGSVDSQDSGGKTPLMYASEHGRESLVRLLLLQDNVSLDSKDEFGLSALGHAAYQGHETVVKLLLEQKDLDVNSRDINGRTPLSYAAEQGDEAVVKLFLARNQIQADSEDIHNQTPLSQAALYEEEGGVSLLLEKSDVDSDLQIEHINTSRPVGSGSANETTLRAPLRHTLAINSKDFNGFTPLMCAALMGHAGTARLLLEQVNIEPNARSAVGWTALSCAAFYGRAEVVPVLLEHSSVDVNLKSFRKESPLCMAVYKGYVPIVRLLVGHKDIETDPRNGSGQSLVLEAIKPQLEEKSEPLVKLLLQCKDIVVDEPDSHGRTLLSWAFKEGKPEVVKILLQQHYVKTDSVDDDLRTPLSYAAQNGNEEVIKLLLEQGDVKLNSKDKYGRTALWYAARWADTYYSLSIELLLQQKDIGADIPDIYGRTPLSIAAGEGDDFAVKLLLQEQHKVEPDSTDVLGRTPLLWAARGGHEEVVEVLLEHPSVKASSRSLDGQSLFSAAAYGGNEAIVKRLLQDFDMDINLRDNKERTPLSNAAYSGSTSVVKLLLEQNNIEPDSKDTMGQTPLSWAAQRGHEQVVRLLLDRDDVDATSKDIYGCTPLSRAAASGHENVVNLLLEKSLVQAEWKDVYGRTPLSRAAEEGRIAVVRLLLGCQNSALQNSRDSTGQTPLFWAVRKDHCDVAEILLEQPDADVDVKDDNGRTPLSITSETHKLRMFNFLLNKGADVSSRDVNNRTPLSWAAANGQHQMSCELLKRKVDTNSKDRSNRTPLSWAAEKGKTHLVVLLLRHEDIEVDVKDEQGRTPLTYAKENGHTGIVKLLEDYINGEGVFSPDSERERYSYK